MHCLLRVIGFAAVAAGCTNGFAQRQNELVKWIGRRNVSTTLSSSSHFGWAHLSWLTGYPVSYPDHGASGGGRVKAKVPSRWSHEGNTR